MTLSVDTIIIVSLMMAVFAAVATVGSSLYLGAGYERLRAGFETIKKQTAFFSDALHKMDHRVEAVEKQSGYFFQAITNLEKQATEYPPADAQWDGSLPEVDQKLISVSKNDVPHAGTDSLLTSFGFTGQSAETEEEQDNRPHFH